MKPTIALAWTGASGMIYGLRLLECLLAADARVSLLISKTSRIVARNELQMTLPAQPQAVQKKLNQHFNSQLGKLQVYGNKDWNSPLASGSNPPDAYVVCPCTMGRLAKFSAGLADDLICRTADVVLKEKKTLLLVPRETPFSSVHLENMLRLNQAGAVILPPIPGFYAGAKTINDLVDFVVARILDHLAIKHDFLPRWGN